MCKADNTNYFGESVFDRHFVAKTDGALFSDEKFSTLNPQGLPKTFYAPFHRVFHTSFPLATDIFVVCYIYAYSRKVLGCGLLSAVANCVLQLVYLHGNSISK